MSFYYLFLVFIYFIVVDIVVGVIGLFFASTKSFHSRGIRMMAMSSVTSSMVPHICCLSCDGNCGNWTCRKFHENLDNL